MNRAAVILAALLLSSGGALERPCNRICRYSPTFGDGQICIGCFLTVDETRTWASMDATQRGWAEEDRADRSYGESESDDEFDADLEARKRAEKEKLIQAREERLAKRQAAMGRASAAEGPKKDSNDSSSNR